MISKVFLVFVGGGIGTVLRYLLNYSFSLTQIPQISTLLVNVLGSFLFGIIYAFITQNTLVSIFLLTGVLGGFTTYSQFTFDLIELNAHSQITTLLYFFGTIILSILAGLLGVYIGTKMVT
tara:strand:- start:674 stop:1036 length:363 start_codon:yes stop_codon:yes gene_type:complete